MTEKTVADKLLLKSGKNIRFINAPPDVARLMGHLPEGTSLMDNSANPGDLVQADVIVLFANNRTELETLLPGVRAALASDGMVWIAYHKGTSKVKTDINRDSIYSYAKTVGLEGIAMASIDEDWSALRLKVVA